MTVSIACAGQLLVHDEIDTTSADARQISAFLDGAAAFSNLEACVETVGAWSTKTKTLHLCSPAAVASLGALGFDGLTHANNHAFDLGPPGLAHTRHVVEAEGLAFTGSGADVVAAMRPANVVTPGGRVSIFGVDLGPQPAINYAGASRAGIAPLAVRRTVTAPASLYETFRHFNDSLGEGAREAARAQVGHRSAKPESGMELFGVHLVQGESIADHRRPEASDWERLIEAMAQARHEGAALIAICLHNHHWEPDWTLTPNWLLDLSRRLIDAGADLILGHGAPVLQGVVFHKDKPIIAGAGNLFFHTRRPEVYRDKGVDVFRSAMFRATFNEQRACTRLDVLPVAVGEEIYAGPQPAPSLLSGRDAAQMMERVVAHLSPADRDRVQQAS